LDLMLMSSAMIAMLKQNQNHLHYQSGTKS
jgi:hypothetical protein